MAGLPRQSRHKEPADDPPIGGVVHMFNASQHASMLVWRASNPRHPHVTQRRTLKPRMDKHYTTAATVLVPVRIKGTPLRTARARSTFLRALRCDRDDCGPAFSLQEQEHSNDQSTINAISNATLVADLLQASLQLAGLSVEANARHQCPQLHIKHGCEPRTEVACSCTSTGTRSDPPTAHSVPQRQRRQWLERRRICSSACCRGCTQVSVRASSWLHTMHKHALRFQLQ